MRRELDLADIQGNIVRPYGRFGFPVTRHFFFNIDVDKAAAGRKFVDQVRQVVTTAERWGAIDGSAPDPNAPPRPLVAVNIGFSYQGFQALDLPTRTISLLPEEFIDGMAKRASILGDVGKSAPDQWDPIWAEAAKPDAPHEKQIHIWVSLNAQINEDGTPVAELVQRTLWLKDAAAQSNGVTLLSGHLGPNPEFQDSSARMERLPDGRITPTAKEHFDFTDGIADPTFAGQYEPKEEADAVIGSGKISRIDGSWKPLATGEFILGHASEAQELPPMAQPWSLMRNGTFMAYRKLHQNIAGFNAYVAMQAALLVKLGGAKNSEAANATIRAKMVGRWPSGIPTAIAPSFDDAQRIAAQWADIPALYLKSGRRSESENAQIVAYERMLTDFRYKDDGDGAKCPVAAHIRRTNPRDALDPLFNTQGRTPDSTLTNRRRVLRRGLPYGEHTLDDTGEHGVAFMALCASLFNQFEFVQQQWVQYGSSFSVGNDTDPIVGLRRAHAKYVIPADPKGTGQPFICADLPLFVETRGGEYFFLPSLTALREIAQGSVDPT
jgi:Dyp-type peroxidase family